MPKLAILVVYYLEDSDEPILKLHLNNIKENTEIDYKVYATATKVSRHIKDLLEQQSFIHLLNTPSSSLTGSKEHSHHLDELVEFAIEDGADYICTLDVDSFPIRRGWDKYLVSQITADFPLIGVLRAENEDTVLPHPCCTIFSREFFVKHAPKFYSSPEMERDKDFIRYLESNNQEIDTGIGYGYTLWKHNINWLKLLRSNKNNDHFLLGAIYSDTIFHLGAMGWKVRDFRKDRNKSSTLQVTLKIEKHLKASIFSKTPLYSLVFKTRKAIEQNIGNKNNKIYQSIRTKLIEDPETYYLHLLNRKNFEQPDSVSSII